MFQTIKKQQMLALALRASHRLLLLLCKQVWGKVSVREHSSTSLWQQKRGPLEPCKDKHALQFCLATDRKKKIICQAVHTMLTLVFSINYCISVFPLLCDSIYLFIF